MKDCCKYMLLSVLCILLFSCVKNDSQLLKVVLAGNPNTLDPHATSATITAQVNRSIYDTLLQSPDGTPLLAQSWRSNNDATQWTFILKKGVLFHNGSKFTSKDVVATINRIRDKSNSSPFLSELSHISKISAADDYTLTIALTRSDYSFPFLFASSHMGMLPHQLIDAGHDFARVPVGTGPFVFEKWEDGVMISLVRNQNYFLSAPTVQGVNFYILTDSNAYTQAIIRKDIDVIPYIIEPELSRLKKEPDISIVPYPGATILLLAMNTRVPPFDSLEFRKAIAQSINKQQVIDIAYPSSKVTNVFWHSTSQYYTEVPEIYDPAAAKSYFQERPPNKVLTITAPSNFTPHVRAAQVYQSMFESVGLETKIAQVDWGTWISKVYTNAEFEMTVIGHTAKMTPNQRLSQFEQPGYYVGWKDEHFLNLVAEARVVSDSNKRQSLYKEAFTVLTHAYPFVFVGETTINFAIRDTVHNMFFDPILETYDFTHVTISSK